MSNPLFAMGKIAEETVETFMGDLFYDGMFIERRGRHSNYLWSVRPTGTSITCLDRMDRHDLNLLDAIVHTQAEESRFFLVGNRPHNEGYIQEVSREEVQELYQHFEDDFYAGR